MPRQMKNEPNILRSLQYFEAVARHGSLKQAAIVLGVTQSAVSHQLRRFSETIGQQLLIKSGRGIALTPAGKKLGTRLSSAFADLEGLVREISRPNEQVLRLAVCSSFGPGWLIERVEDFYRAHPEVRLDLRLYARNPLFSNFAADAYVVADELKPGFVAVPLRDEFLVAVEAPRSAEASIAGARRRLITTDVEPETLGQDWVSFSRKAGFKLSEVHEGPFHRASHYILALEMAKRGLGVALVPDFLASRDIGAGLVVRFIDRTASSGRTYHLCFKSSRAHEAKLMTLVHWFRSVLASDETHIQSARQQEK
jgi:LysR family glycine cleavage system transcriptional activator